MRYTQVGRFDSRAEGVPLVRGDPELDSLLHQINELNGWLPPRTSKVEVAHSQLTDFDVIAMDEDGGWHGVADPRYASDQEAVPIAYRLDDGSATYESVNDPGCHELLTVAADGTYLHRVCGVDSGEVRRQWEAASPFNSVLVPKNPRGGRCGRSSTLSR